MLCMMYEMHLYLPHSSCVYIFQPKSRVSTIIACISSKHHHQTYISLWEIKPQQNAQSVMFDIFISQLEIMKMRIIHFDGFLICTLFFVSKCNLFRYIHLHDLHILHLFCRRKPQLPNKNILQRQATLHFVLPEIVLEQIRNRNVVFNTNFQRTIRVFFCFHWP